jgi:hypothetical protein
MVQNKTQNQVLFKRRPQAPRERGCVKDCPLAAVQSTRKESSKLHYLFRSAFLCQQGANEKEDNADADADADADAEDRRWELSKGPMG